jgi:hypothetical protein
VRSRQWSAQDIAGAARLLAQLDDRGWRGLPLQVLADRSRGHVIAAWRHLGAIRAFECAVVAPEPSAAEPFESAGPCSRQDDAAPRSHKQQPRYLR